MALVTVVAAVDFDLNGRTVHEGEAVQLEAVYALAHARRGHVTLDQAARPTYHTRDMNAEPVDGFQDMIAAAAVAAVQEPAVAAPIKRRRGRPRKNIESKSE